MKSVLITGGTGSFGHAYVRKCLASQEFSKIIVLSRDEMKQWHMEKSFDDSRLRFFVGDVRDQQRLHRAFANVDRVFHAAITKKVTANYFGRPSELGSGGGAGWYPVGAPLGQLVHQLSQQPALGATVERQRVVLFQL